MTRLVVDRLGISYQDNAQPVLHDISLQIESGELLVVLGASGSGKTTLLNAIAGFVQPTTGEIRLNNQAVSTPSAERGVVFQDDVLLPWQNVAENIGFALKLAGLPQSKIDERVQKLLQLVQLPKFAKRQIWQLSGGQRQRVGLARALAADPQLLLLDEPFGALDAVIREDMQALLLSVWQQTNKPMLLITHDIEEALFLATKLIILAPAPAGVVESISLPFSQRFASGESARSIKSAPEFIALREQVLAKVFAHHYQHTTLSALQLGDTQ